MPEQPVSAFEAARRQESAANELSPSADELIARRLVRLLKVDGARSRANAAAKLARYRFPEVVEGLCAATIDADPLVREHAIRSLAEMRSAAAVGPLARALSDREMRVRRAALTALAESRSDAALEALAEALDAELTLASKPRAVSRRGFFSRYRDVGLSKEASADFRVDLVRELGHRATPQTFPTLCRALQDPDLDVRVEAARGIGELAAARPELSFDSALTALRRRVGTWRVTERRAIRRALEQVEEALGIAGTTDLPLPAAVPRTNSLPLPGAAPAADSADLPRPAAGAE